MTSWLGKCFPRCGEQGRRQGEERREAESFLEPLGRVDFFAVDGGRGSGRSVAGKDTSVRGIDGAGAVFLLNAYKLYLIRYP